MEGKVPITTKGRNRTVPPNVEVVNKDVQDLVKGNGPAQAPPSTFVTLVLQDTLACMFGLLEGMA